MFGPTKQRDQPSCHNRERERKREKEKALSLRQKGSVSLGNFSEFDSVTGG